MGLLDVLVELSAVVDELNETVEIILVHREEHTSDLTVVLGHSLEHGVEEVVTDGGLGLMGLHGLELILGGQSEDTSGGGDGGSSGHDGDGLVDSGATGTHGTTSVVGSAGVVGTRSGSARARVELRRIGTHGREGVHLLLDDLLGGNALRTDGARLVVADNQGLGEAGNGVTSGISDGLLSSLSGGEADISESTRLTSVISSDASRGDGTELGEVLLQNIISNAILQRLDEQVRLNGLAASSAGQRSSALRTSLGTSNKESGVVVQLVLVHLSNGLNSIVVVGEVDETIAASDGSRSGRLSGSGGSLSGRGLGGELVLGKEDRGDLTILGEDLTKLGLLKVTRQVLDKDVGPLGIGGRDARLARHVLADMDLLVIPHSLVETGNGLLSSLGRLEMNKTETLGVTLIVSHHLAGKDVSIVGEGVVQLLGIIGRRQVLDEEVSDSRATNRGITLRPHQTDGAVQDLHVRLSLHSLLSCSCASHFKFMTGGGR